MHRGDSNTQNINCANANDQPATCLTSAVGDSNTQKCIVIIVVYAIMVKLEIISILKI